MANKIFLCHQRQQYIGMDIKEADQIMRAEWF